MAAWSDDTAASVQARIDATRAQQTALLPALHRATSADASDQVVCTDCNRAMAFAQIVLCRCCGDVCKACHAARHSASCATCRGVFCHVGAACRAYHAICAVCGTQHGCDNVVHVALTDVDERCTPVPHTFALCCAHHQAMGLDAKAKDSAFVRFYRDPKQRKYGRWQPCHGCGLLNIRRGVFRFGGHDRWFDWADDTGAVDRARLDWLPPAVSPAQWQRLAQDGGRPRQFLTGHTDTRVRRRARQLALARTAAAATAPAAPTSAGTGAATAAAAAAATAAAAVVAPGSGSENDDGRGGPVTRSVRALTWSLPGVDLRAPHVPVLPEPADVLLVSHVVACPHAHDPDPTNAGAAAPASADTNVAAAAADVKLGDTTATAERTRQPQTCGACVFTAFACAVPGCVVAARTALRDGTAPHGVHVSEPHESADGLARVWFEHHADWNAHFEVPRRHGDTEFFWGGEWRRHRLGGSGDYAYRFGDRYAVFSQDAQPQSDDDVAYALFDVLPPLNDAHRLVSPLAAVTRVGLYDPVTQSPTVPYVDPSTGRERQIAAATAASAATAAPATASRQRTPAAEAVARAALARANEAAAGNAPTPTPASADSKAVAAAAGAGAAAPPPPPSENWGVTLDQVYDSYTDRGLDPDLQPRHERARQQAAAISWQELEKLRDAHRARTSCNPSRTDFDRQQQMLERAALRPYVSVHVWCRRCVLDALCEPGETGPGLARAVAVLTVEYLCNRLTAPPPSADDEARAQAAAKALSQGHAATRTETVAQYDENVSGELSLF